MSQSPPKEQPREQPREQPSVVGAARPSLMNVTLSSLTGIANPDTPDPAAVVTSPIMTLAPSGVYERNAPFFVDAEQATANTKSAIKQYFGVLKQQHQNVRIVRLPHARVTGQGAVIARDNHLVKESVVEFTAQGRPPDGFLAAGPSTYSVPNRIDFTVDAPCLLVKRPWYANFGHWLVDGATVLALAAEQVRSEQLTIVVGRPHSVKMRALMMDTINQIVPGAAVLQHPDSEIWQFAELRYVTPPHVPPLFKSPVGLRQVRAAFMRTIGEVEPRRRLFISRRTAANRRVANEAELFELCAKRGFEMVEPEQLPLLAQAKLFAEASAIVGVKGAALTNCIFCAPSVKTMVLSPADFPDPFFWDVCAQRGDYGEIFGPTVTQKAAGLNEFTIEPARLNAMLDAAGL